MVPTSAVIFPAGALKEISCKTDSFASGFHVNEAFSKTTPLQRKGNLKTTNTKKQKKS